MKEIKGNLVGVDQGNVVLFSDFEDGGTMWTGRGPRERVIHVAFRKAFTRPPSVHVSLAMFDLDQRTNQRVDLGAENITEAGFDIVFKTWGDSRIARARAAWMAIGELPDPERWNLE